MNDLPDSDPDILGQSLGRPHLADPPPELASTIMREVAAIQAGLSPWQRCRRTWRAARLTNFSVIWRVNPENETNLQGGGFLMTTKSKALVAVAASAAIVIAVFALIGFPPRSEGTAGTVGAANRYQATKATPKDAVTEPAIQQFMQTDTFDRLLKDASARTALAKAVQEPAFVHAMAEPGFQQALSSPEFVKALSSPEFVKALADPGLHQALSDPGMVAALANPGLQQALHSPGFQQALADPGFQRSLAEPGFTRMLSEPSFQQALSEPAFGRSLSSQALQQSLMVK